MFDIDTKANIAFKRALGKIHSSNDRDPGNEPEATKVLVAAQDIWADSINIDPLSSENNGIIARGSDVDSYGKGLDDRLVLELQPISGTDNYGPYSGYYVKIPSGGVPASLNGKINPLTGAAFATGDRVGNIVPSTFGFSLRPQLFNGSEEIPPTHECDWYVDSYAGIVTQEDDDPSKMVDLSASGYLHCYVYVGDYVSNFLDGLGSGTTYTFYENQTLGNGITGNLNGVNTVFELDHTPIESSVQIYLNGMLQEQGQDYTISGATITFTDPPEIVTIDSTDYPDKIVASYRAET